MTLVARKVHQGQGRMKRGKSAGTNGGGAPIIPIWGNQQTFEKAPATNKALSNKVPARPAHKERIRGGAQERQTRAFRGRGSDEERKTAEL